MGTQKFQYGPYELVCTATPARGGGFTAGLLVALGHDSAREETFVSLGGAPIFTTAAEAFTHARDCGQEWVDNFG